MAEPDLDTIYVKYKMYTDKDILCLMLAAFIGDFPCFAMAVLWSTTLYVKGIFHYKNELGLLLAKELGKTKLSD